VKLQVAQSRTINLPIADDMIVPSSIQLAKLSIIDLNILGHPVGSIVLHVAIENSLQLKGQT
jgi:hypothetical protein